MSDFDHPNVLSLRGICLDGGQVPYIVTPFMSNGSLLSYLKRNSQDYVLQPGSKIDNDNRASAMYSIYTGYSIPIRIICIIQLGFKTINRNVFTSC